MKQPPSPESANNTTPDAYTIPQPREKSTDTTTPQTTAGTESGCAIDPEALRDEVNEQQVGLRALEVETYRRMATKLREFLGD